MRAPPGRTNFVTLRIVPPMPLTTERNSVPNSTGNSSEDGTTPGDHTLEWMVSQTLNLKITQQKRCEVTKEKFGHVNVNKAFACCLWPLWFFSFLPDQDVCKLYCFAEGYDFFFALASKVTDGTLCSQDSSNVCIDGLCEVMLLSLQAVRQ